MRRVVTWLLGYRRLNEIESQELLRLQETIKEQQWQIDSLFLQFGGLSGRIADVEGKVYE